MMKFKPIVTKALGLASIVLFAVLVCVTAWQVFSRQVLHSPSTWSEELSKLLFVWLSFAGSAFLFGERGHIAVDFIARKLPVSAQRVLQVIVQLLIVVFAILGMIWGGYLAASIAWNQQLTALPLTLGWVYVVIPIAGVFIALFAIIDLIEVATGKEEPYPLVDESEEPRDLDELEAQSAIDSASSAEGRN